MIVLAVDPGSTRSGWVVYDCEAKRVLAAGDDDNAKVKQQIRASLNWYGDRPFRLVLEAFASHGQASMAAVQLCQRALKDHDWSLVARASQMAAMGATTTGNIATAAMWAGMFCAAAGETPDTVARLTRKDVLKAMHIASKGADAAVRAELIRHFGVGSEKKGGSLAMVKGDAWAALALAVVYAARIEKDANADEIIRKGTL